MSVGGPREYGVGDVADPRLLRQQPPASHLVGEEVHELTGDQLGIAVSVFELRAPRLPPELQDYFDRAMASASGWQTPHRLDEAFSWHERYLQDGTMRPS
jgi:hypothetical protein